MQDGYIYPSPLQLDRLIHILQVSFDSLGHQMAAHLKVRKGSPAAREDEVGFFGEFTPEKMAHYRPEQIATILRQRENVSPYPTSTSSHPLPLTMKTGAGCHPVAATSQ